MSIIVSPDIPGNRYITPCRLQAKHSPPQIQTVTSNPYGELERKSFLENLKDCALTLGAYSINAICKAFGIDSGVKWIEGFVEQKLHERLFRPDQADKIPNGIKKEDLISIKSENEPTLYGQFFKKENSNLVIIFLHGYASTIFEHERSCIKLCDELNVNVAAFDYRGYGFSENDPTGTTTIKGAKRDVVRIYEYLTNKMGFEGKNVIFYGASLGGPFALEAYKELKKEKKKSGGVLLLYPFSSIREIVRDRQPISPLYLLPNGNLNSKDTAQIITDPIHIAHGDKDKKTPKLHAKRIHQNLETEKKDFFTLEGIGHDNIFEPQFANHPSVLAYIKSLKDFMRKHFPEHNIP